LKVVYDTCVYIEFLRSGKFQDVFTSRHQIRYLSPVVMMELVSGARKPEHFKALDQLILPYSKGQRIIALESNHFFKSGECLAKLTAKKKDIGLGLSHDILIAISAWSIGATLFTLNKKDFSMIEKQIPVKLHYL
jgi:predicted nucleic acid-binding protein